MLSNTGINKVLLLGEIVTEPGMLSADDKSKALCFILLTAEQVKRGIDIAEHNEYHNIAIPERLVLQENLKLIKGQTIYIEGKLHTYSFTDSDQIKRYNLEVIAVKIEVL